MYAPTELVPGSRLETLWIPAGHVGIELTVWRMRSLARAGARDPLLRETAAHIVRDSGTDVEAALRIREWLEGAVTFVHDPIGTELLKSPRYQLEELELEGRILGDCDDVALLGAALGEAIGLPARFCLLAFTIGAPFEHVYAELLTSEGWLELDTTKPHQLPSGLEIVRTAYREA